MSWFEKLLRHDKPQTPFVATVIYEDGSRDTFNFWAESNSIRDALKLAAYWMPQRETQPNEILISRRGAAVTVQPSHQDAYHPRR